MRQLALLFALALTCIGGNSIAATCEKLPKTYSISQPLTVHEIEAEYLRDLEEKLKVNPDMPKLPFGFVNKEWVIFKSHFRKGDTLVHFISDQPSWRNLSGREGYAILRQGCVVTVFSTAMN